MTGKIYSLQCSCHPEEGVRYIGQTTQSLSSRKYGHVYESENPGRGGYKSHLSNWIRKHGSSNLVISEIEATPEETLDDREIYWIAKFRDEEVDLVNKSSGGKRAGRWNLTPEQVQAMSKRKMGHEVSEETREKIRQSKLGVKRSPETIRKMSEGMKGKTYSREVVEKRNIKVSEAWTDERREQQSIRVRGESSANAKLTEVDVREMKNLREAGHTYAFIAEKYGVHRSTASGVIRGLSWSHVVD